MTRDGDGGLVLKQTRKLSRHHACVRGRYHELFRDGSGGGGGGLALLFDKYAALGREPPDQKWPKGLLIIIDKS